MNEQRFDDLSRRLAGATSRRGVLKVLVGAATGSLFAGLSRGAVEAAKRCKTPSDCRPGEDCTQGQCRCQTNVICGPTGQDVCCPPRSSCHGGQCVCGDAGYQACEHDCCPPQASCGQGECVCPAGSTSCISPFIKNGCCGPG